MPKSTLPATFTTMPGKSLLLFLWALVLMAWGADLAWPERPFTVRTCLALVFRSVSITLGGIFLLAIIIGVSRLGGTPRFWEGVALLLLVGLIQLWIMLLRRATLRLNRAGLHYQQGKTS